MPEVPNSHPPVVTARDEQAHRPGPEHWWNESWYADVADLAGGYGAWLRFGLYPNRSQTWFNLVVVRPDRTVAIVTDLEAPLATGDSQSLRTDTWTCDLTAEVPLERWRVRASATARAFTEPTAVYRGETGEPVDVELDLTWHSRGEPYHYGVSTRYEISAQVSGTIGVGGDEIEVDAPGQRDHSWAVRDWWAFAWCWSSGALDDGSRFHLSDIRLPGGPIGFGYRLSPTGERTLASHISAEEKLGHLDLPTGAEMTMEPEDLTITAEPVAFSPLVFTSDDGRMSRFPRALCRYRTADGRTGSGWTEWNQPVPEEGT